MFKLFALVFAAILAVAFAAPKPGVVAYTAGVPAVSYAAPVAYSAYSAPVVAATYGAHPVAYSGYGYGAPVAYY